MDFRIKIFLIMILMMVASVTASDLNLTRGCVGAFNMTGVSDATQTGDLSLNGGSWETIGLINGSFLANSNGEFTHFNPSGRLSVTNGTVSMWIRPTVNDANDQYYIYHTNPADNRFYVTNWGTAYAGAIGTGATKTFTGLTEWTGSFQHIAIVWGNNQGRYYVNGTNVANYTISALSSWNTIMCIGGRCDSTSPADAYIDEVLFYDHSLHNDQIQLIYENQRDSITYPFNPVAPSFSVTRDNPANGTRVNDDVPINFTVAGSSGATNCSILVNTSFVNESINLNNGANGMLLKANDMTEGYNIISFVCEDGLDSSPTGIDSSFILYMDSVTPIYDYVNMIQDSDGMTFNLNGSTIDENLHFNISVSDNNLWLFNVTVCHEANLTECEFTYEVDNIENSTFIFNDTVNIGTFGTDGLHYFFIKVADYHTRTDIRDIITVEPIDSGTRILGSDYKVTTGNLQEVRTNTLRDRVTWDVEFTRDTDLVTMELYDPDDEIKRVKSADYLTFVHGDQWTDFISRDGYVYDYQRVNANKWIITMKSYTPTKLFRFESSGIINKVNITVTATIEPDGNVTYNLPFDGQNFIVNNTNLSMTFNYTPFFTVTAPNNCSFYLNGTLAGFDNTIVKNVLNEFMGNLTAPPPNQNISYAWNVTCKDGHLHPPSFIEEHIFTDIERTVWLFNEATSTTTSTTTTTTAVGVTTTLLLTPKNDASVSEFQSGTQASFVIFLTLMWVIFVVLLFVIRGKHGQPAGLFNILQVGFGLVASLQLMRFSYILGFTVLMCMIFTAIGYSKTK